jgi:hypothetical protein
MHRCKVLTFYNFQNPDPRKTGRVFCAEFEKNTKIDSVITMVCIFEDLFLTISPLLPGQPFCEGGKLQKKIGDNVALTDRS